MNLSSYLLAMALTLSMSWKVLEPAVSEGRIPFLCPLSELFHGVFRQLNSPVD